MTPHSRGAKSARAVAKITLKITLEDQRAQGMPGDDLTHGPPATKKAGGSHHRFGRINRHSLRDGLRLISPSPRGPGFLAPVIPEKLASQELDLSVGRPGPRDFAVRASHVRLTCHPRPSHPRPTCRDDRAYVPLHRGGMREKIVLICPTPQALLDAADWHDGQFPHGRMRELPAAEGVTRHLIDS
jgi:hypothetical protein